MRAVAVAAAALAIAAGCVNFVSTPEDQSDAANAAELTRRAYARMDAATGTAQLVRAAHCASMSILGRADAADYDADTIHCLPLRAKDAAP